MRITEADIDWRAENTSADEEIENQREYAQEVAECCGGKDPWCGHWGQGK